MAKRGNGAGSIYHRKSDNKWVGSITLEDGKRKVVQEILGLSQISMTLDVYSHVLPSMQEDVTKRWDDDFGAAVPVPAR